MNVHDTIVAICPGDMWKNKQKISFKTVRDKFRVILRQSKQEK